MTSQNMLRGFDWETAGRETGERLGAYHALVVIGSDPVSTGRVAIGIARAQAGHRRVAVGDLFAESWPIQELVQSDDPHGLVDSFLYGVSLSRIAYEVPGAGQLFVMPSGTEPPDYEEILPNPRWHRLTAGFKEVGALLVLAAPASAPRIADLVAATDGAILVGEVVPALLPASRVVGTVREPRPAVPVPVPTNAPAPVPANAPAPVPTPSAGGWSRTRIAAAAGLILTIVLAGIALWLAYRPLADSRNGSIVGRHDTTGGATPVLAASLDSIHRDSTGGAGPIVTAPRIANPADSAVAADFSVELVVINTLAGAILKLQNERKDLPASTFTPTIVSGGARWFEFVSGAFNRHEDADSLLATLGRRRMLLSESKVVRRPFAFLIDSVPVSAAPAMVAAYVERGQPVYALRQQNGTAWLLMGAFASPEHAALQLESLRASSIPPVLVYRKGRAF